MPRHEARDILKQRSRAPEAAREGENDARVSDFRIDDLLHLATHAAKPCRKIFRIARKHGAVLLSRHQQHRRLLALYKMDGLGFGAIITAKDRNAGCSDNGKK